VLACNYIGSKREHVEGENPLAFLYKLSIFFFVDRFLLIVSNEVLRRNRIDIYAQAYTNNKINSTPNSNKSLKHAV
jgi:hypothetical protein